MLRLSIVKIKSMKMQRVVGVVLILIVFIFSSCTLTKRHYQPGYHVEWHFGKKTSNYQPEQVKEIELNSAYESEPIYSEIEEPVLIASEKTNLQIDYTTLVESKTDKLQSQGISIDKSNSNGKSNFKLLGDGSIKSVVFNEPEFHWTAITSLSLGIVGFFIPFFPCIAAIIFGIISLNKINSEPDKFKGRRMAIAGIVLGIVGIFYIIGLAVLMFMAFL